MVNYKNKIHAFFLLKKEWSMWMIKWCICRRTYYSIFNKIYIFDVMDNI